MKHFFFLVSLLFVTTPAFSQAEDNDNFSAKLVIHASEGSSGATLPTSESMDIEINFQDFAELKNSDILKKISESSLYQQYQSFTVEVLAISYSVNAEPLQISYRKELKNAAEIENTLTTLANKVEQLLDISPD